MLNTNCGVLQGRKRSEYHRRRSKLHVYGRTAPARQSKSSVKCLEAMVRTNGIVFFVQPAFVGWENA